MNRKILLPALLMCIALVLPVTAGAIGTIDGTVTVKDGGPLAGTQVQINSKSNNLIRNTVTDAYGYYSEPNLNYGTDYEIETGYAPHVYNQKKTGITVLNNATTTVNFVIVPFGGISGTVTDSETGMPIANIPVSVGSRQVLTDAAGNYRVPDLSTWNNYAVSIWGDTNYVPQTVSGVEVTAGNTTIVNVSLVLGGSISGTITDVISGAPISGLTVEITDGSGNTMFGSTQTDGSGNYAFFGLPVRNDYLMPAVPVAPVTPAVP